MASRAELLMPVTDDQALRLAEIEAMRAIRDSVAAQARHTEALTTEVREQGKAIADVRERVIRIEAGKVDAKVEELEGEIEELKADKLRREGAMGLGNWLFKNWPGLLAFMALIAVVLKANGKL